MSQQDQEALLCAPDADDGGLVSTVLEGMGIVVVSARSHGAALELANTRCFALILLDLDCDPSWKATLEALRDHAPDTPVVVFSRLPDERMWIDALEAGAFDLACKPFSTADLLWILENACKQQARNPAHRPTSRRAAAGELGMGLVE